jgi:hypothetical protein
MKKLTGIGITVAITAWGKESIMLKRYRPFLNAFIFWGGRGIFCGVNGIPFCRFVL